MGQSKRPYAVVLLLALMLCAPRCARAQDLGSTAMAMDAGAAMETNATRGAQAQINRASAIAGRPAPGNQPGNSPQAQPVAAPATAPASAPAKPPGPPAAGAGPAPAAAPAAAGTAAKPAAPAAVDLHAPFKDSFFFTAEDLIAIHKAILARDTGIQTLLTPATTYIPPIRRIKVAAVIYDSPDKWMVYINNQWITPNVSMKEIVDIKVERDLIHLKWYDIGANKVLVLTMRPNETYDIVTGVLLPG
jgi:hypothetical protein